LALKNISGQVLIDNEQVGSISGTYQDDSYNGSKQVIESVSVPITVTIDNEQSGNGEMNYQDYVTYNGGGTRTVNIDGYVTIDNSDIGTVNATLIDSYGYVIISGTQTSFPWWIIIVGIILLMLIT